VKIIELEKRIENPNLQTHERPVVVERDFSKDGEVRIQPNTRKAIK
jgi:hypothetical protein